MANYPIDPNIDPYAFANSQEFLDAAQRPSLGTPPASEDFHIGEFLSRLQSALEEPPEPSVAPPMSLDNAPLNRFGFLTASYNPLLKPFQAQELQDVYNQRKAYPQAQQADRARMQQQRISNLTKLVDVASQAEQRRAMAYRAYNPALKDQKPDNVLMRIRYAGPNGEPHEKIMLRSQVAEMMRGGITPTEAEALPSINTAIPYQMQFRGGYMPGVGAIFQGMDPYSGYVPPGFGPLPSENTQQVSRLGEVAANDILNAGRQFTQLAKESGGWARGLQQVIRKVPLVGGIASSYLSPRGEITSALFESAQQMKVYILSGKQVNENEFAILARTSPQIGENIQTAFPKLATFIDTLAIILRRNAMLYPGTVDPSTLQRLDEASILYRRIADEVNSPEGSPLSKTPPPDAIDNRRNQIPRY